MRCWLKLIAGLLATVAVEAAEPTPDKPTPLNPQGTVLLDKPGRRLLLKGEVCLREGVLEMFACLKRTKEHESIVSVDTQAWVVHAGLLALGAEPGQPVQFVPEYRPPSGQPIEVYVSWEDEQRKLQRVKAQTWVRRSTRRYWVETLPRVPADLRIPADSNLRWDEQRKELLWYGPMSNKERDELLTYSRDADYQKAIHSFHKQTQIQELDAGWVFAGSGFYTDRTTGQKFYQAEGGDLICVANFATATLDLAIPSSATNDELLFEAYTERIPPVGTAVTVELHPVPARKPPPPGPRPMPGATPPAAAPARDKPN
jgi:hypothetical protein